MIGTGNLDAPRNKTGRRDLMTFVGSAAVMLALSPTLAVWSLVTGVIMMVTALISERVSDWPYSRTLLALSGGFVAGSLPYFILASVMILLNPA